jgi:hypothetical protein
MADLDLEDRCKIYAQWFTPKVAKHILIQMDSCVNISEFLRSEWREYLQAMFAGACDTTIMHHNMKKPGDRSAANVDVNKLYETLRGIPAVYFPNRPTLSGMRHLPWVSRIALGY